MELTDLDRAVFEGRPREVDHGRVARLHHLGTYRRELPNSLKRMMENAYDWEHLPFIHPASFAGIELVEQGSWGWRCKVELPNGAGTQAVELLVDRPRHYWATTVVEGFGQGVEIHTQASENGGEGIMVEVRFYLPQAPESDAQGQMLLSALSHQYARLYDEDEALMTGRQAALDAGYSSPKRAPQVGADFGPVEDMARDRANLVEHDGLRLVVRRHRETWIAHSATCPHMLGPLEELPLQGDQVVCPWHGFHFSLETGEEHRNRCGKLPVLERLREVDGRLILSG